jgi:urease accessory protein
MVTYTGIIGSASQPELAERLHQYEHEGKVDYVTLTGEDIQRHRLRVRTDRGEECGIALERSEHLFDGAVLQLDESGAVVVRSARTSWLRVRPRDTAAGLELGYFAGNMHWSVRFEGAVLCIALKGATVDYLQRLQPMLTAGSIVVEDVLDPDSEHEQG